MLVNSLVMLFYLLFSLNMLVYSVLPAWSYYIVIGGEAIGVNWLLTTPTSIVTVVGVVTIPARK